MNTELNIIYCDPKDLKPYQKNAVIHSQAKVEELGRHILASGKFDQPIVVDKDMVIIKGHRRRLASIWAKLAKVPVVVRDDLSEEQVMAIRLGDNKLTDDREYDITLLKFELDTLQRREFDLGLTGFSLSELEKMDEEASDSDKSDDDISGADAEAGEEENHDAEEAKTQFIVTVNCDSEEEMKELFEELQGRQYNCRLVT